MAAQHDTSGTAGQSPVGMVGTGNMGGDPGGPGGLPEHARAGQVSSPLVAERCPGGAGTDVIQISGLT